MYVYMHIHICIYIYIYTIAPLSLPCAVPDFKELSQNNCVAHRWNRNPRPQPRNLVNWSNIIQLILHVSKLVIWGSSWGWGFRFHWLVALLPETPRKVHP